jgi:xanthine dehydrogenase accessory protein XdhC
MIALAPLLARWIEDGAVVVTLEKVEGSTPREAGATMIVGPKISAGTIGGGQLEFHTEEVARSMLLAPEEVQRECRLLDLPLGPQMGQCCGGRVLVRLERARPHHVERLAEAERIQRENRPKVFVFGAGHTGKALVWALSLLPLAVTLVDDRPDTMTGLPAGIDSLYLDTPEIVLANASPGSAVVILTHSHAMDYKLAEIALNRGIFSYVGLIGSATKRARFLASYRRNGGQPAHIRPFVCPIGGNTVFDKRPEVIAALTAAEIVARLLPKNGDNSPDITMIA